MAKKIHLDDIIVSEKIGQKGTEIQWKVVAMIEGVEYKQAGQIAKVLKRVLPPKYYCSSLGPGQYKVGSTYWSK